jgi:arsenite methyltransferase
MQLREEVQKRYSMMALDPGGGWLEPAGRELAVALGYPQEWLATVPDVCVEAFYGVANLAQLATFAPGSVVLDLGCGSGLDTLYTASQIGSRGRVVGVDSCEPMLDRARLAVVESNCQNVSLLSAPAECLPFPDATFDAAVVNGIFNLNPTREAIFSELARVLRPGGDVWAAELIAPGPPSFEDSDPESWFT